MVENHLDRQFAVVHPLPVWFGDITYLPTREGWMHLAAVIDLRTWQSLVAACPNECPTIGCVTAKTSAYAAVARYIHGV